MNNNYLFCDIIWLFTITTLLRVFPVTVELVIEHPTSCEPDTVELINVLPAICGYKMVRNELNMIPLKT